MEEMTYEAKLTKVGNSIRVIVPKLVMENLGLEPKQKVKITIKKVE